MNFSDLKTRFSARYIGNELSTTLIEQHLNVAYKNFLAETEFPMEETVTTLNFVANDRSKALPANTFSVLSVRDTTNNVKLSPQFGWGTAPFFHPDEASTATPNAYQVIGGNLYLFPVTNAALTVEIFYSQEPADLSGTDTPIIPLRYHDAIVCGALAFALMDDERPELAQVYATAYNSFVEQAVAELRNARQERYVIPQDTFYTDGESS